MKWPSKEELQKQVDEWNSKYPVGTKVKVKNYDEEKVTKSEAKVMIDQKAIIFLEGHNGYFDLDDVSPV